MARRNDRFLNESPSVKGTVTGFNIAGYRLLEDRPAIAIMIAIDWLLSERADSGASSAMSTTWTVTIYGRSNEGRIATIGCRRFISRIYSARPESRHGRIPVQS